MDLQQSLAPRCVAQARVRWNRDRMRPDSYGSYAIHRWRALNIPLETSAGLCFNGVKASYEI